MTDPTEARAMLDDAELIARLLSDHPDYLTAAAADRITALLAALDATRAREVNEHEWRMDAEAKLLVAEAAIDAEKAARVAAEARADELAAVIDSTEIAHGLTSNGNLWRFWSRKACDVASSLTAMTRDRDAKRETVARLTEALTQIAEKQFVRTMRYDQSASFYAAAVGELKGMARAALTQKEPTDG